MKRRTHGDVSKTLPCKKKLKDILANQSNILGLCVLNTNYIQQHVREGDAKFALNQSQCKCLGQMLDHVTKNLTTIFSHANVLLNNFDLLFKELFRVIERTKLLVQQCYGEKWWHAALLQIHNEEAFQDLFMDLKSSYDDIFQHLKGQWVGQLEQYKNDVRFSLHTMKELGDDDHRVLMRRLQETVKSTQLPFDNKGLHEELTIAKYLLKTYGNLEGKFVSGGNLVEVDARQGWEGSIFLQRGAYGSVEKTTWFGLPCAKKVQGFGEKMEDGENAFKKEVAILASVNHPNVVKFICCGRKPEKLKCFIAMELLDTSLEKLIKELSNDGKNSPFTIPVAIDIILQIAKGMSYLHEKEIAHRDLKPDNVLVHKLTIEELHKDNYVIVKLADFGLSKANVNSSNSEKLSQGVGTRLYKAPELFQKTKHNTKNMRYLTMEKVNAHEADVYSFGVVCATVLSGKQPFEGIDHDLPTRLRLGERPWVPDNCPEALVSLINECWSFDRTRRPKFKEICTTLKDLRSSISKGCVALTNQEVENEITVFQRILYLPHNVMYFCKQFWKKQNLEERETNEAQHPSQIHGKGFQLSSPLSWANCILPSQVRSIHSLLSLPIHFVNIDKTMSNVLSQLECNQILGIIGMGGSGKTTLTKAILHHVHQGFEATSFVANMRDSKNVLEIQRQLLRDLKTGRSISTIEEGFKCLQHIFEKRKVFVVFDDVASQEQVHALVSSTWVFAKGSKIIATSRNWQDLKTICISHTGRIDMELLDKDQAKELFYKHAFSQQQPQGPQFEKIVNKVIKACGGLPLSLEVLGCYLCGVQRLRIWEQALRRLQRGQCLGGSWDNERIWKTLRISYDNLNEEEQNMFLDIACFFCRDVLKEGMQEEKALKIWNSNDNNAHLALLNLMDRSIVRVDSDGMLTMHDHLRDMGRMIACKERIGGQRIWNFHEFEATIPYDCMMIQNVEGLQIDGSHCNYNIITNMDLANIRLLHINNCDDVDHLYKIMKTARKLRWMHISMLEDNIVEDIKELQPSFFIPFTQLRVLEMEGFMHLQHLPLEIGSLLMLEYLTLFGCEELKFIPETFGNLTSLVILELIYCKNLKELPVTFGNLTSLVTLHMSGCKNLQKLPETFGNLTSLVTLDMSGCENLQKLPEAFGNLTSLVTLDMSGCKNLQKIPKTFGNLTALVTLDLYECFTLKELPDTWGNLTSMGGLYFGHCKKLKELPETLGNLTSLVTLNLNYCWNLKELPETLGNLTSLVKLNLRDCSNLRELPERLGNMSSLNRLDLSGCEVLETLLETLGNLTSLVTLDLNHCMKLKELPKNLGNLTSLITLNLMHCSNLKKLPNSLGNLTSLVTLNLMHCSNLKKLPNSLGNLTSLVTLILYECLTLKELPETLGNLSSLVTLDMRYCKNLDEIPETLGNLTSLVTLRMSSCKNVEEILEILCNLTSLVTFELSDCKNLEEISKTLCNVTSLKTLKLGDCLNLMGLPKTLSNLTSLVTLNLYNCPNLKELPETLGNLTSLVTLNLYNCSNLKELPETLGNLTSLVALDLCNCSNLKELPETLGNLTSLVALDLCNCSNLKELPKTLGNLTSLVRLNLNDCSNLKELPETLGNLTSLDTLELSGCENLKELPKILGGLTLLVTLNLNGCKNLEEIPEIFCNLTSLFTLELKDCSNLKELPKTLGNLISLHELHLKSCSNLKELPETLGNLTLLETLDLSYCMKLKKLPKTLGNLTLLDALHLKSCLNLKELPETLGNLTSLVTLNLSFCKKLEDLPETLGNLTSLVTLDLNHCMKLKNLPETLGNLTSLVTLELIYCKKLKELPKTLGNLTSLFTLELSGCLNLKEMPKTLGNLTSLVTLNLYNCSNLKELPKSLGNLTSLVILDMSYCHNLEKLPETLGKLASLVALHLSGCTKLKELPETLCNLTSLVTLNLDDCSNLKELPKTLGKLNDLVITGV